MAKRCIIANPINPNITNESIVSGHIKRTDWQKCIFCQDAASKEKLQCPANSKRADCVSGYTSLASILPQFVQADLLPPGFSIERLDDGSGLEITLSSNHAKWHKSCRMFFYSNELNRAAKRRRDSSPTQSHTFAESNIKSSKGEELSTGHSSYRRSMSSDKRKSSLVYKQSVCFICDKSEPKDSLHKVRTRDVDERVRKIATTLCDSALLAKLSDSDLLSQEAQYHTWCLNDLYNKKRTFDRRMAVEVCQSENEIDSVHGIVFAQLISYIEDIRADNEVAPIFKLADLTKLYADRLSQLIHNKPLQPAKRLHSTRVRERLQDYFPTMRAQNEGRDVLLVFDDDIGPALLKACQYDCDRDAVYLSKAAQIIRRTVFDTNEPFAGKFLPGCQERAVSQNLLALITMILEGPSITTQTEKIISPPALTISQLITFNCVKHERTVKENSSTNTRRNQTQETPLPLYISLLLHATTRKRSLIDELFNLGVCVSYDRILTLTTTMGNDLCDQYNSDQVVCPLKLRKQLFTVAAVDNIDHNPTATTARGAFHGTAISLMQQPDNCCSGIERTIPLTSNSHNSKKIKPLPESYSDVLPVRLRNEQPTIPDSNGPYKGNCVTWTEELDKEHLWLDTVKCVMDTDADATNDNTKLVKWFSWSAYHADKIVSSDVTLSIVSLLPLFPDSSNSVAMIRHSMNVIKNSVQHLNPDQIPVITFDQPLYAIAKCIQWNWPDLYGESQFVVVMGGLHIEMAGLKAFGSLLKGCGWVEAVTAAGITTPGTAEAIIVGVSCKTLSIFT